MALCIKLGTPHTETVTCDPRLPLLLIIRGVEAIHHLPRGAIAGQCRDRSVVRWRHYAMFLARRVTGRSYPQIGRAFNRHHTTVMAAVKKWERRDLSLLDDF